MDVRASAAGSVVNDTPIFRISNVTSTSTLISPYNQFKSEIIPVQTRLWDEDPSLEK